jgi:hypothetical protein
LRKYNTQFAQIRLEFTHGGNVAAKPGPSPQSKMKHHNHWRYERVTNRMNRRAEAALGYLMALAIGCGLAAVIVYGWQA